MLRLVRAVCLLLVALSSCCVARIPPEQRRFVSVAVDAAIADISARLRDPEIAQLFTNAYPNTLDTTVWNFTDSWQQSGFPDSFIITGDIHAQWCARRATESSDAIVVHTACHHQSVC